MSKILIYLKQKEIDLKMDMQLVGSNSKKFLPMARELSEVQQALKEAQELKQKGNELVHYLTGGVVSHIDNISANEAIMKNRYLRSIDYKFEGDEPESNIDNKKLDSVSDVVTYDMLFGKDSDTEKDEK